MCAEIGVGVSCGDGGHDDTDDGSVKRPSGVRWARDEGDCDVKGKASPILILFRSREDAKSAAESAEFESFRCIVSGGDDGASGEDPNHARNEDDTSYNISSRNITSEYANTLKVLPPISSTTALTEPSTEIQLTLPLHRADLIPAFERILSSYDGFVGLRHLDRGDLDGEGSSGGSGGEETTNTGNSGAEMNSGSCSVFVGTFNDSALAAKALRDLTMFTDVGVRYYSADRSALAEKAGTSTSSSIHSISSSSATVVSEKSWGDVAKTGIVVSKTPTAPTVGLLPSTNAAAANAAFVNSMRVRTIYVTSLGSKDKADIYAFCKTLPGFYRVQFGQTNFRVVLTDPDAALKAMAVIQNTFKLMKATFARKEPEVKRIEELGEASRVLWTSTLYWSEGEFRKHVRNYEGFERVVFDAAHSWVHFRDVDCARKALEDLNSTTNLYSVFSKKYDRDGSAVVGLNGNLNAQQSQQNLQNLHQQHNSKVLLSPMTSHSSDNTASIGWTHVPPQRSLAHGSNASVSLTGHLSLFPSSQMASSSLRPLVSSSMPVLQQPCNLSFPQQQPNLIPLPPSLRRAGSHGSLAYPTSSMNTMLLPPLAPQFTPSHAPSQVTTPPSTKSISIMDKASVDNMGSSVSPTLSVATDLVTVKNTEGASMLGGQDQDVIRDDIVPSNVVVIKGAQISSFDDLSRVFQNAKGYDCHLVDWKECNEKDACAEGVEPSASATLFVLFLDVDSARTFYDNLHIKEVLGRGVGDVVYSFAEGKNVPDVWKDSLVFARGIGVTSSYAAATGTPSDAGNDVGFFSPMTWPSTYGNLFNSRLLPPLSTNVSAVPSDPWGRPPTVPVGSVVSGIGGVGGVGVSGNIGGSNVGVWGSPWSNGSSMGTPPSGGSVVSVSAPSSASKGWSASPFAPATGPTCSPPLLTPQQQQQQQHQQQRAAKSCPAIGSAMFVDTSSQVPSSSSPNMLRRNNSVDDIREVGVSSISNDMNNADDKWFDRSLSAFGSMDTAAPPKSPSPVNFPYSADILGQGLMGFDPHASVFVPSWAVGDDDKLCQSDGSAMTGAARAAEPCVLMRGSSGSWREKEANFLVAGLVEKARKLGQLLEVDVGDEIGEGIRGFCGLLESWMDRVEMALVAKKPDITTGDSIVETNGSG